MKFLITLINESFVLAPVHETPTFADELASPNPEGVFCANVMRPHRLSIPNTAKDKTFNDNFFIFLGF